MQYVGLIPDAERILRACGKEVAVGRGDGRICHPGQVLGCNFSSASSVESEVDAFLFLGEGDFHPLAAAFGSKKKVLVLNPLTGAFGSVDEARDRILRRRFAMIESARPAESFLVIMCDKPGQSRRAEAERIAAALEAAGRRAYLMAASEITPEALIPYAVDAYVNAACPRIAMDDSARYPKPMLTIPEAEIVAGLREWGGYEFDSI